MMKPVAATLALTLMASPTLAQDDTIETLASEAEVASVAETLAKIGCEASEVEKESATLFEVDDATCGIGQYDIKLDAAFNIISMTRDE